MQIPEVEPKIVFDTDIDDETRQLVETMDGLIPGSNTGVEFLYRFDAADELVRKTTRLTEGDVLAHEVSLLRAIAGVFKSHADASFGYDHDTEIAARTEVERYESEARRIRRLRTYVGRKALWLNANRQNEIAA